MTPILHGFTLAVDKYNVIAFKALPIKDKDLRDCQTNLLCISLLVVVARSCGVGFKIGTDDRTCDGWFRCTKYV